jgi:predicted RNA-binding protein with PIN domain
MRYLLVDGHSVIFAWPELSRLHAKRGAHARAQLVKLLTGYQDNSGVRVVVVFDGKGEQVSEETEPGGIQIFYSAGGGTADEIIERLTAKYAGTHDITVVTRDRLEQQTVVSFGGHVIGPQELRGIVVDAEADLARRVRAHRRKK